MADEAKTKDTAPAADPRSGKLSIGMDELQALIAASVSQAVTASSKIIAEAMLESRKPYISPADVENQKRMRESTRESQERILAQIAADQDTCPHKQGSNSLSEFQSQLGSFVLHQLDTGVVVGICTNCQKKIWSNSNDPSELKWFREKQANRISRAGQRVFRNPEKAQAAR
jgi:hypothetical protein